MPRFDIVREVDTPQSFRVSKVASMFDVPLREKVRHEWHVNLPLNEKEWQLGLVVGPSGCGKTTIARECWPDAYTRGYPWTTQSILDNFPPDMESGDIVGILTSVGFSSPPDWVKPYQVLSTGQQMRADLARALASTEGLTVFDEFTSVVDRTVAKVGSAALAKAVRRQPGRQFIAVTCHEDVLEWLAPDWIYEPATGSFAWRFLRRPFLSFEIARSRASSWALFREHHYMSADLNRSAACYLAYLDDKPVAFQAVLPVIGFKGAFRSSRTVVLPDYQGIGLGSALSDYVADLYFKQGKRYRDTLAHPALIAHYQRPGSGWKLASYHAAGTKGHHGGMFTREKRHVIHSKGRSVVTFEYIGKPARGETKEEEASVTAVV
jgi:ABC-type lipoprotein export system ATPase subunit